MTAQPALFWPLAILTILLAGLMSFIKLSEFVEVMLLNNPYSIPFGAEAFPWYYRTAELYANINLLFGLLSLTAFVAGFWTTIKKHIMGVFATLLSTGLLILIMIGIFS